MSETIDVNSILRKVFGENLVIVLFQNQEGWQKNTKYPTITALLKNSVQFDAKKLSSIIRECGMTSCRVVGGVTDVEGKLRISSEQYELHSDGGLREPSGARLYEDFGIHANILIIF